VYPTDLYRLGYLCAKNYQIWWKFDEVLTKTSWVMFGTPSKYQPVTLDAENLGWSAPQ